MLGCLWAACRGLHAGFPFFAHAPATAPFRLPAPHLPPRMPSGHYSITGGEGWRLPGTYYFARATTLTSFALTEAGGAGFKLYGCRCDSGRHITRMGGRDTNTPPCPIPYLWKNWAGFMARPQPLPVPLLAWLAGNLVAW